MRMTHNYLKQQFGGGYSAPDLEIYSVPVDRGFEGTGGTGGIDDISGDNVITDDPENWI